MPYSIRTTPILKYTLTGLVVSLLLLNSKALPTDLSRQDVSTVERELEARAPPVKKSPPATKPPARRTPGKKALAKKTPAKKAPAKKTPAKKAPVKKPLPGRKGPAKGTPGKKGPAKKAPGNKGGTCAIKKPGKKLVKRSESLYRRAPLVEHPSTTTGTTLFHGAYTLDNAKSAENPNLSVTSIDGDLHLKGSGCDGGFYLADSLFAAAQFVCYNTDGGFPDTAYVNEYTWIPPQGVKVRRYTGKKDARGFKKECQVHDVLEAPMLNPAADMYLSQDFMQYAVLNQKTATAGLKFVKRYVIPCKNVEKGSRVPRDTYRSGQRADPNFDAFAAALEGKC